MGEDEKERLGRAEPKGGVGGDETSSHRMSENWTVEKSVTENERARDSRHL